MAPQAPAAAAAAACLLLALPAAAAAARSSSSSQPVPYMIDQAGHTVSSTDVNGFSVSRLASYGVRQVAAGSIDCATTLGAVPGGPWYDAAGLALVKQQQQQSQQMVATAHAAGLKAYLASDIFEMPDMLLAKYGPNLTDASWSCIGYRKSQQGCIALTNFTRYVYGALFDELLSAVPGIDGLVLRYGENSPCDEHSGNAPYDATTVDTMVATLQDLLLFLREELCVKRNLTVIMRTWDTSTQYFHANATFYELVTNAVEPHPLLVFSVKHTMLDFWRRVRLNPTLGVGRHLQVVEGEVGGMYGGCGTWPLYIGSALIDGYEEYAGTPWEGGGLNSLLSTSPSTFGGVLTNHQCTSTPAAPDPYIWWRLEEAVIAGWARSPGTPEPALFEAAVRAQLGIEDAGALAAFRNLTLLAMQANLRQETCAVFDVNLGQVDRPTANYLLWDGIGGLEVLANDTCHAYDPMHCEVYSWLVNNSQVQTALAEKAEARAMHALVNATAALAVAPHIPNATIAAALRASAEAGAYISSILEAGWTVTLLGYEGDRAGGKYNASGIRAGVGRWDAAREGYRGMAARWGAVAPGLVNGSYWQHPASGVPGMAQSVDRYRGV
jgi:hypothetical protein